MLTFKNLPRRVVDSLSYFVGRKPEEDSSALRQEWKRAQAALSRMAAVSQHVRQSLAQHHASVMQFKERLETFQTDSNPTALTALTTEAERLLAPTEELAASIAQAYETIRRQTAEMGKPNSPRIDALTGVGNRRALEDSLEVMLELRRRTDIPFTIALIEIEGFPQYVQNHGVKQANELLKSFAQLLDRRSRDTDEVTRIEHARFVMIFAHTSADGVAAFGRRIHALATGVFPLAFHIGIAEATATDSCETLLARSTADLMIAKRDFQPEPPADLTAGE